MLKRYYKIEFKLTSPLSVGSGENDVSDSDIVKSSDGKPFVPGTSLAGIYRTLFDKKTGDKYFGSFLNEEQESKLLIYDAVPVSSFCCVGKRDGVGLDEYKAAMKGAKYDFEVIEPNVVFVTFIEQNCSNESEDDIGKTIVSKWKKCGLKIGAKTARGYGNTEIVNIWKKTFDFTNEESVNCWLEFNLFNAGHWNAADKFEVSEIQDVSMKERCLLRVSLEQRGGISVRKYTTRVNTDDNPEPDYEQMAYKNGNEIIPFIPGTSWAGAFRHHMKAMLSDTDIEAIFGKLGSKSKINFYESLIKGSVPKMITRNAIDRFTGGTENGALYTERTYYGGTTELCIEIPKNLMNEGMKNALAVSLADLHLGILSMGGLTAVGRGLFKIQQISVSDTKEILKINSEVEEEADEANKIYSYLLKNLPEANGGEQKC